MKQIIPLTSDPNQTFQSSLSVDGNNIILHFKLHYNEMIGYWVMSISDQNDNLLIDSLPLIPSINLLEQYSYLKIGSAVLVNAGNISEDLPTSDNLGTEFILSWGDTI